MASDERETRPIDPIEREPPSETVSPTSLMDGLALFETRTCPFCVRVRNFLMDHGRQIEIHDVRSDRSSLDEMFEAAGSRMVPCLRIEKEDGSYDWMHESSDIIDYLKARCARGASA